MFIGKEIMEIKILDNFEKTLIALDDCGYENNFSLYEDAKEFYNNMINSLNERISRSK